MTELIETDVLIIGCGIAGGTAALKLAQAGVHVTLITRSTEPAETNTSYAQGGIIYRGHDDSPQLLAEDIDHAGAHFTNPKAVRVLIGGRPGAGARHSDRAVERAVRPSRRWRCRWRARAATPCRASCTPPMPPAQPSKSNC